METTDMREAGGSPRTVPTGIYRLLRVFTVIYPGEAAKALLHISNVFVFLFACDMIKPVFVPG